jgi:S-methylmethionine-dependent homocysteine/selenocysteine methylase
MSKYRNRLPQLNGGLFLTDSGLETTMIFHEGFDMPSGEAFKFMDTADGRKWIGGYFRRHAVMAVDARTGFLFESPTWRANISWGKKLGYTEKDLVRINRDSIRLIADLRAEMEAPASPMVLSGCLGPLGDGYRPDRTLTVAEAEDLHGMQIRAFVDSDADMVAAITMTTIEEATGIALAAKKAGMPSCISFTLETDGRLPTGQTLKEAIEAVDAATGAAPAYYMINCAHPTHFATTLADDGKWTKRIRGLRANASKRSHAELDECDKLDIGDPKELGAEYRDLLRRHPQINVIGGCCGTDHRHVAQICNACKVSI